MPLGIGVFNNVVVEDLTEHDSRLILDRNGAENLVCRGDM